MSTRTVETTPTTTPATTTFIASDGHRVTVIHHDGACRCERITSPWGGRTTHTTSQCNVIPPNADRGGDRR